MWLVLLAQCHTNTHRDTSLSVFTLAALYLQILSLLWVSLKSSKLRGLIWQLNNSRPVITAPSPDVDFPLLTPYDYSAQRQVITDCSVQVSECKTLQ